MSSINRFRRICLTTAALGGLWLMQGAAMAQSVQMFEEAPPLELLRSIMIPESHGGATRSIVLGATRSIVLQDAPTASRPAVVPAAASIPADPTPATPVATAPSRPAPIAMAAVAAPVMQVAAKPPSEPAAATAGVVGFRINFALDSAAVPDSAVAFLDRMAELMKQEPQVKLRVEGHTDARGSAAYNQSLSERRAAAVANYLVHRAGIGADRLVVEGKGMAEPLTRDPYDAHNRRVQFVRIG